MTRVFVETLPQHSHTKPALELNCMCRTVGRPVLPSVKISFFLSFTPPASHKKRDQNRPDKDHKKVVRKKLEVGTGC